MKVVFYRNWQYLLNIYLFVNFAGWGIWNTYQYFLKGELGYVELSFTIQSLIVAVVILIRKPHRSVNKKLFHQAVALAAFVSGAGFFGQPAVGGPAIKAASQVIIFLANSIGIITLINLGRSFGILIAFRELKSYGLYSIVRHPMYGTDILLRIGFLIGHLNLSTCMTFTFSTICYVYRAILEEQYLCQFTEYREYMKNTKYRFMPFIY